MSAHGIERRVLSAAATITDAAEARRWYHEDPIAALDGSTAAELVRGGRGTEVLDFVMAVLRHEEAAASTIDGSPDCLARRYAAH